MTEYLVSFYKGKPGDSLSILCERWVHFVPRIGEIVTIVFKPGDPVLSREGESYKYAAGFVTAVQHAIVTDPANMQRTRQQIYIYINPKEETTS